MIKQILGRLPQKPSKSSENREFEGSSASPLSNSFNSGSSDRLVIDSAPLSGPNSTYSLGFSHGSKLAQVVNKNLNGNSVTAP
ncbi:hypothetical protein CRYUN_Cryun06bG0133000 [Craigia yunnanensis]